MTRTPLVPLGILGVISFPFTGPIGLFGGTALIIAGGVHQTYLDKEKPLSKAEPKEEVQEVSPIYTLQQNHGSYSLPENSETAVARRIPYEMTALLERENKRKNYNEGLMIGADVARNYLDRLSTEEHSRISNITIIPEQQTFFGRKSLEVKIKR